MPYTMVCQDCQAGMHHACLDDNCLCGCLPGAEGEDCVHGVQWNVACEYCKIEELQGALEYLRPLALFAESTLAFLLNAQQWYDTPPGHMRTSQPWISRSVVRDLLRDARDCGIDDREAVERYTHRIIAMQKGDTA